jgi:hypothetical protein
VDDCVNGAHYLVEQEFVDEMHLPLKEVVLAVSQRYGHLLLEYVHIEIWTMSECAS